jgi:hypothetical protein
MEKTLDLKMPGVIELGREELKEVGGGEPVTLLVLGGAAAIVGLAVGWKALCDEVHEISKEIGASLARE